MSAECDGVFYANRIYHDYILPIIGIILTIITFSLLLMFIIIRFKGNLKLLSSEYYVVLSFFILIVLTNIIWTFIHRLGCQNVQFYDTITNIGAQLYISQTLLIIFILYRRLCIIFNGTTFALSNKINKLFWTIYTLTIIIHIIAAALWVNWYEISGYVVFVGGVFVIASIAFLYYLFISKLLILSRTANNKQKKPKKIMNIVIRTALLGSISTSVTLLFYAFVSMEPFVNSIHWSFARAIIADIDLISNFCCIFLSFDAFNEYYLKICYLCNVKCTKCWENKFGNGDIRMVSDMVQRRDRLESVTIETTQTKTQSSKPEEQDV